MRSAAHVEEFTADQLARLKASSANNRYRGLQAFFKWGVGDDLLAVSPMAKMKPPAIPETPPPVITLDQQRRLLKACEGKDFVSRRDTAILMLLIDTPLRLAELAGIKIEDVDFDVNVVRVLGKGRRVRACPFGDKSARALDRYLYARQRHRDAKREELWLGLAGPMTDSGIYQMLGRRAQQGEWSIFTPT